MSCGSEVPADMTEPAPPAGLSEGYRHWWLKSVQQELAKGKKLHEVIKQINHDIGIHEGIHDRIT